jgi:hypothetical protein
MAGYWKKVFSGAWEKTYKPLGWDRKKVAVVIIAVGTIVVAGVHLGLLAMIPSAVGYMWIAAPVAFAAFVLFVSGIFETQSEMYAGLSNRIIELEAGLARLKAPPPDYAAWRHVHSFDLRQASFLWCELNPAMSMPFNVQAWYNALGSAVQRGELLFEPRQRDFLDKSAARQLEKQNPELDTVVKRSALQDWAKRHGYDPVFLRDT